MEKEIWKEIPFDPRYKISNLGRVSGIRAAFLNQEVERAGYYRVTIGGKHYFVHRLVLSIFDPIDGMEELQVNHIDGDKLNNKLNNLEWVTPSENATHSHRILKHKSNTEAANEACSCKVKATMPDGEELFFASQRKCAEALGLSKSSIAYNLSKSGKYEKNGIVILKIREPV